MPDILLIQPPIQDFYLTAKRTMPYGLACIAASLRQAGFSVDILDGLATTKARVIPWPDELAFLAPYFGRIDRSPFALFHHFRHFGYSFQHIGRMAAQSGAHLIGISSLFSAYSETALQTAVTVRQYCPDATIVMGGHHPSVLPEMVIIHPAVDVVLRGDGEATMPRLAQALRDGNLPGTFARFGADSTRRHRVERPSGGGRRFESTAVTGFRSSQLALLSSGRQGQPGAFGGPGMPDALHLLCG